MVKIPVFRALDSPSSVSGWQGYGQKNIIIWLNPGKSLGEHFYGIWNKPPIYDAYTAIFVEQPSFHPLDKCEDRWYHQRDVQVNIQNMIVTGVK